MSVRVDNYIIYDFLSYVKIINEFPYVHFLRVCVHRVLEINFTVLHYISGTILLNFCIEISLYRPCELHSVPLVGTECN